MKKQVVIIMVLVFAVIAAIVWLFLSSNKGGQTVTTRTESTGLTNFFANSKMDLVSSLFSKKAQEATLQQQKDKEFDEWFNQ